MTNIFARGLTYLERMIPWLALGLLLFFTHAWFFQTPYAGFNFSPAEQQVSRVYVTPVPEAALQVSDRLIQVGPVRWSDFASNARQTLFEGIRPGQVVPIVVERNAETLTIPWVLPGPTRTEVLERLNSEWFLAYVFWLAGAMTYLILRPRDTRWRLFLAFNFLTALWLAAGTLSRWHTAQSLPVLHAAVWLSVPVYWHLHWIFPQSLGRVPVLLVWLLYFAGGSLALADWLGLVPNNAYFAGFVLALVGSMLLLSVHFLFRPAQRRDIGLLGIAAGLALLPSIGVGIAGLFATYPSTAAAALLTFPLLPLSYLYAAYRRQLGGLEVRANQLAGAYAFVILLITILTPLIAAADAGLSFPGKTVSLGLLAALVATALTAIGLTPFQRFIERYLLGMRLPPVRLLETYAERITVSLDRLHLIQLLRDEILPSLLIRQSALLRLDDTGQPSVLYAAGVEAQQLPSAEAMPRLLAAASVERRRLASGENSDPCPWVRLALPLTIGRRPIGVWLLGRRDPDDYYAQSEIQILRSLAHQTAIALTNILQAEQLLALYRSTIEQVESERSSLAWELHDNVLGQLAALKTSLAEQHMSPRFAENYRILVDRLRETISGLRPAMLNFGLYSALSALVDDWAERHGDVPEISLDLPKTDVRYEPRIEQHLYRIVQHACENALRYAQADRIRIQGQLLPDQIELTVTDDGNGFLSNTTLDLAWLLENKHFGLAGMHERAALIGAAMQIDSGPAHGTRIRVIWRPDGAG